METNKKCVLCSSVASAQNFTLLYDFDVCDSCRSSQLRGRIRKLRGWNLIVRTTEHDDDQGTLFDIMCEPGFPIPLHLKIRRELMFHKFLKLFKTELQVGDEYFDQLMYIETKTKLESKRFLKDNNVRNAIWDILGLSHIGAPSFVQFKDNILTVRTTSPLATSRHDIPLSTCLLMHFAERISKNLEIHHGPYR